MKTWQKMNKGKRGLILLLVTVMLIAVFGMLPCFNISTTAHAAAAYSGTPLSPSTQAALETKMKSKYFTHGGTQYHINQYYSQLHGNAGGVTSVNMSYSLLNGKITGTFQQTDPITSLIPYAVFDELKTATKPYWCMGEQWGVIIDPVSDSYGIKHMVVQVIEITTDNNIASGSYYTVEMEPLFELDFVWISGTSGSVNLVPSGSTYTFGPPLCSATFTRTGSAGMYALPAWYTYEFPYFDGYGIIWVTSIGFHFSQTKRNYINNFSFAGTLVNEQDANPSHNGYVANQDYGAYFVGSDMNFNAYSISDLTNPKQRIEKGSPTAAEVVQTILGILSIFDPTPISGIALSGVDVLDLYKGTQINTLPPERLINSTSSAFLKYNKFSHSQQTDPPYIVDGENIGGYGHLIKDCAIFLGNENFALTPLGRERSYAKAMFLIAQERKPIAANPTIREERYWMARFGVGFNFDIRRFGSNSLVDTAKWEKSEVLGNTSANYKTAEIGQVTVFNYFQNTSRFSFTAPTAGYYKMYFANTAHDSWYRNFGTSEIYLNANQVYNFALEYINTQNNVSISELVIEKADLQFTLINKGTAYSVSGLANISNIVIPSYYRGLPVKEIAANAFVGLSNITSVTFEIPSNIQTIGNSAFSSLTKLSQISIPASVSSIGQYTFIQAADLRTITNLSSNPQIIDETTFSGVDRANIQLIVPQGTTQAYINAGWTGFIITEPDGTHTIDGAQYIIEGSNAVLKKFSGSANSFIIPQTVLINGISRTVTKIGDNAFKGWSGYELVIPSSVINIGADAFSVNTTVKWQGNYEFHGSAFLKYLGIQTNFTIPSTVAGRILTAIGDSAFVNSVCNEITIPSSVTSIGNNAFSNCTSLQSITIPSSVITIGAGAFTNTGIWNNTANNSVVYADKWAVGYKGTLGAVTLRSDTVGIGNNAFQNSSVTGLTIQDNIKYISATAFINCANLNTITVTAGNISFSSQTGILYNKAQTDFIHIPQALRGHIVIPNGITEIYQNAFSDRTGLTGITIPDSVRTIGARAFTNTGIWNNTADNSVVYADKWAVGYKGAIENISLQNGTKGISDNAFAGCSSLTSITIPDSVKNIGFGALAGCNSLTNITLPFVGGSLNGTRNTHFGYIFGAPESISTLQYYDFQYDFIPGSLTSVTITGGSSIAENAFYGCAGLTNITIPASVSNIGDYAFWDCSLSLVTFEGKTSIGSHAFSGSNRTFVFSDEYASHYAQYANVYYTPPPVPPTGPDLSGYDVYELDYGLSIIDDVYDGYSFVCIPQYGGYYEIYFLMRYGGNVSVSVFEVTVLGNDLLYEFSDDEAIVETIYLEAGVYYLFELNSNTYGLFIFML